MNNFSWHKSTHVVERLIFWDLKCPLDLLKALMSSRRVLFVIKLFFFVWETMRHLKFIGIPVNRFSIESTFSNRSLEQSSTHETRIGELNTCSIGNMKNAPARLQCTNYDFTPKTFDLKKYSKKKRCLFMRKPHELMAMIIWWMRWRNELELDEWFDVVSARYVFSYAQTIAISLKSEKQKETIKQEVESNLKILFFHSKKTKLYARVVFGWRKRIRSSSSGCEP